MCNYSLECLESRDAVPGERLVTRRFYTGSLGFASPQDPTVAVCLKDRVRLVLREVPKDLQSRLKIRAETVASFRLLQRQRRWWDFWSLGSSEQDTLLFDSGTTILISRLPEGLIADVLLPDSQTALTEKTTTRVHVDR
ncbi:MAG: hypothetical protein EHM61_00645 [Acidobacteria bacterium]|nr:MAG: hypothetical protein EHM61_00645 [Acidobacteriota bacterium]